MKRGSHRDHAQSPSRADGAAPPNRIRPSNVRWRGSAPCIRPSSSTRTLPACSLPARYLFVLLPTIADAAGRLADRPRRIRAAILPHDGLDVRPLLNELTDAGKITRYVDAAGAAVIQLADRQYQRPHPKEAPSNFGATGAPLLPLFAGVSGYPQAEVAASTVFPQAVAATRGDVRPSEVAVKRSDKKTEIRDPRSGRPSPARSAGALPGGTGEDAATKSTALRAGSPFALLCVVVREKWPVARASTYTDFSEELKETAVRARIAYDNATLKAAIEAVAAAKGEWPWSLPA